MARNSGSVFSLQFSLAYFVEESRSTTCSFYMLLVFIRILTRMCSSVSNLIHLHVHHVFKKNPHKHLTQSTFHALFSLKVN